MIDTVIDLEQHTEGIVLPVRAQPGARQNALRGIEQGMLKVAVTQAPEKGKANRAIIETLAKSLGLRRSQFQLLQGETSRRKRFLVRQMTREEFFRRLREALGGYDE